MACCALGINVLIIGLNSGTSHRIYYIQKIFAETLNLIYGHSAEKKNKKTKQNNDHDSLNDYSFYFSVLNLMKFNPSLVPYIQGSLEVIFTELLSFL